MNYIRCAKKGDRYGTKDLSHKSVNSSFFLHFFFMILILNSRAQFTSQHFSVLQNNAAATLKVAANAMPKSAPLMPLPPSLPVPRTALRLVTSPSSETPFAVYPDNLASYAFASLRNFFHLYPPAALALM